jgi:hypothetical protein
MMDDGTNRMVALLIRPWYGIVATSRTFPVVVKNTSSFFKPMINSKGFWYYQKSHFGMTGMTRNIPDGGGQLTVTTVRFESMDA